MGLIVGVGAAALTMASDRDGCAVAVNAAFFLLLTIGLVGAFSKARQNAIQKSQQHIQKSLIQQATPAAQPASTVAPQILHLPHPTPRR